MIAHRRAFTAALLLGAAGVAGACNALIGAPDRVLDEEDAGRPDRRNDAPDANDLEPAEGGQDEVDAGTDAAITILVGTDWASPNGATWIVDGGTVITAFTATHPVIVPRVQPAIPSEDYTATATVRAPNDGEFGLLTRVQADGSAVLIGSKFGAEFRPFMGSFSPPDWNPSDDGRGPTYTFVAGSRYKLKLRAIANQVSGKMWVATEPEPATFQLVVTSPWSTGRGVGFYTYGAIGAVLEDLEITVP
ncbi:MAG: hypothetical protein KF795_26500 [Labilithrix sp.]|nr:hypothetical protein [Labilithrix sp.]